MQGGGGLTLGSGAYQAQWCAAYKVNSGRRGCTQQKRIDGKGCFAFQHPDGRKKCRIASGANLGSKWKRMDASASRF